MALYVQGLTFHSMDQLSSRFNITSEADIRELELTQAPKEVVQALATLKGYLSKIS
jgi:hypothetical protein